MKPSEGGSSLVEVLILGLVLLVPLIWGLSVLSGLHSSALAASAAVREAGTEAARASDGAEAAAAIDGAVAQAFRDQGVDPSSAKVKWSWTPGFDRRGVIEIEISVPIPVFQAPFIGDVSGPSVWVRARHLTQIDPYASRP